MESQKNIYSRIEGIFETRKLSGETVAIIGLGTGGCVCADELARCAVDDFILVDFDQLEYHNIARHNCGIKDVGRPKTKAVADRIWDINPEARIEIHDVDVTKDIARLQRIIQHSDLVLPCTDNNASRYLINEECLRTNTPAVYAGAYERAFGGMILRVIPGETPCYDCVIGSVQKSLPVTSQQRGPIPYSELQDASEFKAEPGLSIDAHMIALIQAKMALLTLLRGTDSELEDYPADLIFWGNRTEWIFPEPLYCKFAQTTFRSDCPTCQAINKSQESASSELNGDAALGAPYDPNLFDQK